MNDRLCHHIHDKAIRPMTLAPFHLPWSSNSTRLRRKALTTATALFFSFASRHNTRSTTGPEYQVNEVAARRSRRCLRRRTPPSNDKLKLVVD